MPFAYLLQCKDGSYYGGWTVDLENRLEAHNSGKASKYTRARLPVHFVYWEEFSTRIEAQKREAALKALTRRKKEELVAAFKKHTDFEEK
ncbi:GIY-YIG nuclease family protein [Alkaliphilus peptidifermentans]|uniref:Putative endonuclease n=1 Tax=Alkaliphilus peptidifermentans DSM 18978 TaxID=1120976 RepID=A0A1G5K9J1_9FIRM|nr:GIY-YIG nuclease family protein [Alkaliphilus peptidifermentans]SCY97104.1 putative endonuclease [Alkaliphilus peptidifermentans DSM 18978]